MRILITGVAGFIGSHVAMRLLQRGDEVVGIDNISEYYDPTLKTARIDRLKPFNRFQFFKIDISDSTNCLTHTTKGGFDVVLHLAGQAGVRYSITSPKSYIDANIIGFFNVIEACRNGLSERLVYASSSSVYGNCCELPYTELQQADRPVSLYAATKKCNELFAHVYSHLYGLSTIGLRFFTAYGPWGRPDMAYFKFTEAILFGKEIEIYNDGKMMRDFTYIDDIVDGVIRTIDGIGALSAKYLVFNLGNGEPVSLVDFVATIEQAVGKIANKKFSPMQQGDVLETHADMDALHKWTGFSPKKISLDLGIRRFVDWYRSYYTI